MKAHLKWSHALFLFAAIPLIFELSYIGIMFGLLANIDLAKQMRTESMQASYSVSRFMVRLLDSGATVVGTEVGMMNGGDQGMDSATQNQFNRDYWRGRMAIENSLHELVNYLASEPKYRSFAEGLDRQYFALDSNLKAGTRLFRGGDVFGSLKLRLKVISHMENMISMSRQFVDHQLASTFELERKEAQMKSAMQIVIVAFFFSSFLGAGLLAILINRTIARKLDRLSENVSRLAAHERLDPPLSGNDEFATLDSAFRNMFEAIGQAQSKERALVETALDMICTLSESGTVTDVNPACEKILGLEPKAMMGCGIQQFIVEQERQLALHNLQLSRDKKEAVSFEMSMLGIGQRQIETLWSVTWSVAKQSYFCVVHDITERKQAELLRQEITAMISHDLRTPITSIQVVLDLINAGAFGALPSEFIDEAKAAGMQSLEAMDLINDLLDIEKFEKADIHLFIRPYLLSDLIESAWRDIRPGAELKQMELKIDCRSLNVLVDRDQFVRVLRNLFRNSVTHGCEGSDILISAQEVDDTCRIWIEDSGPLLSDAQRDVMFDRFQGVTGVATPRSSGNGLSLSVCKALISAHGGGLGAGMADSGRFMFSLICRLDAGQE